MTKKSIENSERLVGLTVIASYKSICEQKIQSNTMFTVSAGNFRILHDYGRLGTVDSPKPYATTKHVLSKPLGAEKMP